MHVSVLILTLNEEENLPRCLSSVKWCNDVVVLDSFSSDRTEEIARSAGARFVQRRFDDYASQRNYGLNEIEYKHPWVFMLDADEMMQQELVREIREVLSTSGDVVSLFRIRRKDYFMGRWIKRSGGYPTWFGRLVRKGRVKVNRAIHEEYLTDGTVGYLKEHFLHFPFSKGFYVWFEKHNRYSSMEGNLIGIGRSDKVRPMDFIDRDPAIRRKALKSFAYRLPGRPFLVFIGLYLFRGGFLEGRPGFTICMLRAFYEFMIDCKIKERKLRKRGG